MRRRLLMWLVVPLVTLVSLSTFVANQCASAFANNLFDSFLLVSADSIVSRLKQDKTGIVIPDLPSATEAIMRHYGKDSFYVQVVDARGFVLAGDKNLPVAHMLRLDGPVFKTAEFDGDAIRICRVPSRVGDSIVWVRVAETTNSRRALLAGIFWSILIPQVVIIALGCISVSYGVTSGLRPLNELGKMLKSRSRPDYAPIEMDNVPSELLPVTDALNQHFRAANKQFQSQRNFVANAAHQLRTPMTAIRTYLEYLKNNEAGSSLSTTLNYLDDSVERVILLLNRLLVLARAEGSMPLKRGAADLTAAVNEAARSVIARAIRQNVELIFDLPENEIPVEAELADLREIAINLMDNAITYSQAESSVWVRVFTDNRRAHLIVEDNGPGISDTEKERVFDRFYRSPGTKGPGTGLGLAIVKEMAGALGGEVDLNDRAGGGTSIRVSMPLRESA